MSTADLLNYGTLLCFLVIIGVSIWSIIENYRQLKNLKVLSAHLDEVEKMNAETFARLAELKALD